MRRWRAAQDALIFALGANVWVSLALLPSLYIGFTAPKQSLLVAAPLVVLVAAAARRSATGLLVAYPAALLLPMAVDPRMMGHGVYGPLSFTAVAAGLLAFLAGATLFTQAGPPRTPERTRLLAAGREAPPLQWRRRFRIYRGLAAAGALMPIVLLYAVAFDAPHRAAMRDAYPGRLGSISVIAVLAALAVCMLVYSSALLVPLELHRRGDPALFTRAARLRAGAHRAPGPLFWAAVAAALGLMAVFLLRGR